MRSTSIIAIAAAVMTPMIAAQTPACAPTADGYQVEKLTYLASDFCAQLVSGGFASKQKLYDQPVVALTFTSKSVSDCSLADCIKSYKAVVDTCGRPDHSIRGSSTVDSECGTYAFAVRSASETTSLGKPDATLIAATIKTYDVATLTSSSSSSISTYSAASTTTTSASSKVSSTSSHEALTSTSLSYSATPLFANATSTGYNTTSMMSLTATGSTYLVASTSTQAGTVTKPTATLSPNGAETIRISGLMMVGVAAALALML